MTEGTNALSDGVAECVFPLAAAVADVCVVCLLGLRIQVTDAHHLIVKSYGFIPDAS